MKSRENPLDALVAERELSTCPPRLADPPTDAQPIPKPTFRYHAHRALGDDIQLFHHAAVFAVTRWTNVYAIGDFAGGPVRGLGGAVQNIRLRPKPSRPDGGKERDVTDEEAGRWSTIPLSSHSRYWKGEGGPDLLRRIICRPPGQPR